MKKNTFFWSLFISILIVTVSSCKKDPIETEPVAEIPVPPPVEIEDDEPVVEAENSSDSEDAVSDDEEAKSNASLNYNKKSDS